MMSNDSSENEAYDFQHKALTADTGIFGVDNEGCSGNVLLVHASEVVRQDSLINTPCRSNEKKDESVANYEHIHEKCECANPRAYSRFCDVCQYKLEYTNVCDRIRCSDTTKLDNCSGHIGSQVIDSNICIRTSSQLSSTQNKVRFTSNIATRKTKLRHKILVDLFDVLRTSQLTNRINSHDAGKRRKLQTADNVDILGSSKNRFGLGIQKKPLNNACMQYGKSHNKKSICNKPSQPSKKLNVGKDPGNGNQSRSIFHFDSDKTILGSHASNSEITISFSDSVIRDNVTMLPSTLVPPRSQISSYFMTQDNIDDWLSSLRTQTHDYCPHCEPDDSIPTIKSIPSLNFNCCGLLCSIPYYNTDIDSRFICPISTRKKCSPREGQFAVESVCVNVDSYLVNESPSSLLVTGLKNPRSKLMVERFKHELMERRIKSKRRAIYVKVEESNDCSSDGYSAAASSLISTSTHNGQPKRNAFHEINSEFVNDILDAFDNLLRNDIEIRTRLGDHTANAKLDGNALTSESEHARLPAVLFNEHKNFDEVKQPHLRERFGDVATECGVRVKKAVQVKKNRHVVWHSGSCKQNIRAIIEHRPSGLLKFARLLTAIEVSKSFNGFLLTIDNILRQRLSFIVCAPTIKGEGRSSITSITYNCSNHIYSNSADEIATHDQHESHELLDGRIVSLDVEDEDDIYQHIWKFRTMGNPRESCAYIGVEGESLISTEKHDSHATALQNNSSSSSIKDLSEWETDDEFIYSHNSNCIKNIFFTSHGQGNWDIETSKSCIHRVPSQLSLSTGESNLKPSLSKSSDSCQFLHHTSSKSNIDNVISTFALNSDVPCHAKLDQFVDNRKYEMVCILYSMEDIRFRAMIHSNKNYKLLPFPDVHVKNKIISDFYDVKPDTLVSIEKKTYNTHTLSAGAGATPTEKQKMDAGTKSTFQVDGVSPSLQAWKLALLHPFYVDDEEDEYVSINEIFKIQREEAQPMALKKCASEGNLLQLPMSKKKTLGERFMNKVQAVGIFPISPRLDREKKKVGLIVKRRGSVGPFYSNSVKNELLFGASLEHVQLSEIAHIPKFVIDCIKFIEQPDNICTDGLYRASGNKLEIDALKKKLTERYDLNLFEDQDIHNITGLLKSFFRELKTALISDEVYNKLPPHLIDRESLWLIKNALTLLPEISKQTLKYLMQHLTR